MVSKDPNKMSDEMMQLIALSEPLWGGEAEVFRAYWDSEKRSLETDLLWLRRQAYKEYWDGFYPTLLKVNGLTSLDNEGKLCRSDCQEWLEILNEEFSHYCHFVDAYRTLAPDTPDTLEPEPLRTTGNWRENHQLADVRIRHRETYGKPGTWVRLFTEGGHCALFAEGMKRKGRGTRDDAIALACTRVYEDEFEHMLIGLMGLDRMHPSKQQWQGLSECVTEQLRCRILMRNAQFSYPLSATRVEEIFEGHCERILFDHEHAASLMEKLYRERR